MFPAYLKFILHTYLSGLLVFTIFRVILFYVEFEQGQQIPLEESNHIFFQSFWMGFRFDTVISGYLLAIPTLTLMIQRLLYSKNIAFIRSQHYFLLLLYSLAFAICAMDLAYFQQFFSRFSMAAFQWVETPAFMLSMIVEEPSYWWPIIPFFLLWFLFYFLQRKNIQQFIFETKNTSATEVKSFDFKQLGIGLLVLGLLFLAIRGRTNLKSPIRVGTAYFSNYAFANQLGLNPVFTLIRSYIDANKKQNQSLTFVDDQLAIRQVKTWLQRSDGLFPDHPLAKEILPDTVLEKRPNIVLIMMESMSAAKMERYGNTEKLTPYLDQLANTGYSFDNIYTAGIHTFNGVYSTLFSFPALLDKHPMKQVVIPKYGGMASALKREGYSTLYFTTHDDQFDNIGGFLSNNDFDEVIAQKNYPATEIKSTLGVPDDYMFQFALSKLNALHQSEQPFFAALMTSSDHGPYYIPDYFKPQQKSIKKQVVEYADWSIRQFMEAAAQEDWFEQTLFVFIADHGAPMEIHYEIPLNYHHSPLIFYAPHFLKTPKTFTQIGGQIDVFPTTMGLLQIPYINNTLGIDLLKTSRPFIYFSADRKLGVIDQEHLLIIRENGSSSLYAYREKDLTNQISAFPEKAKRMKQYVWSNLQAAQWLIEHGKTSLPKTNTAN